MLQNYESCMIYMIYAILRLEMSRYPDDPIPYKYNV